MLCGTRKSFQKIIRNSFKHSRMINKYWMCKKSEERENEFIITHDFNDLGENKNGRYYKNMENMSNLFLLIKMY